MSFNGLGIFIKPSLSYKLRELGDSLRSNLSQDINLKDLQHCIRTSRTALHISKALGLNKKKQEQCSIAGLLHDCAKSLSLEKLLHYVRLNNWQTTPYDKALARIFLHAPVGASFAQYKYGIEDSEILNAINSHMNYNPGDNIVGKILLLADSLEPARKGNRINIIRDVVKQGKLEKALLLMHISSAHYEIEQIGVLHPKKFSYLSSLLKKEGSELSHEILNKLQLLPNVSMLEYKPNNFLEKFQSLLVDLDHAKNKLQVMSLLQKLFFKVNKER